MSLDLFQAVCLVVIAIAYALRLREPATRAARAREVGVLAVSAWLGEQTCISLYRFYAYAPGWWLRVGDVPALVPLIWPLVVLSAEDVAEALWPDRSAVRAALRVGALVVLDASLIEVVAVAAGLWSWAEPGYLGVPLVGVLGWGTFAVGAALGLRLGRGHAGRLAALPVLALATTHALLPALWWGGLRWTLRGDLGPRAVLGFAVLALTAAALVWRVRGERRLDAGIVVPRVVASAVFFALLASLGRPDALPLVWAHVGLVAVPYLLAMPPLGPAPAAQR